MNKINLLMIALVFCNAAFSQNNSQTMNWKAGESKQISMKSSGKEIKNNATGLDTTFTIEAELKVQKESGKDYIVSGNEKNMLVSLGSSYYKNLHQLVSFNSLVSEISVNKDSLSVTQINQQEYNTSLQKSFDEILKILADNVPEKLEEATPKLYEVMTNLQKNSITSQIAEIILDTYKFKYSKTDTLYTDDPGSNPINLQNFPGAKVKTYLQPTNKKGTFNVVIERIYNFDLYKSMIAGLSQQVSGTINGITNKEEASDIKNQMEEAYSQMISMMDFDATDKTVITWNTDSNWPAKIDKETTLNMNMGGSKSGAKISVNMEIE